MNKFNNIVGLKKNHPGPHHSSSGGATQLRYDPKPTEGISCASRVEARARISFPSEAWMHLHYSIDSDERAAAADQRECVRLLLHYYSPCFLLAQLGYPYVVAVL